MSRSIGLACFVVMLLNAGCVRRADGPEAAVQPEAAIDPAPAVKPGAAIDPAAQADAVPPPPPVPSDDPAPEVDLGPVKLPFTTEPPGPKLLALVRAAAANNAETFRQIRELGPDAAPALPLLCQQLAHREPASHNLPNELISTITHIGPKAVPHLVALLDHESAGARQVAAHVIGLFGPTAAPAVPALARALQDSSRSVRLTAADALAKIGPAASGAVPAMTRAFRDERPLDYGARGLEGSPTVRIAIIRALAAVGDRGRKEIARLVVPILIDDLRHDRTDPFNSAYELSGCGPLAEAALPYVLAQLRKRPHLSTDAWMMAVIDLGPRGVPVYKELLRDTNSKLVEMATRAFYYIHNKVDVNLFTPEVVLLLRNEGPGVRRAAVEQITYFRAYPPELIDAVVGLLGDRGVLDHYPPLTSLSADQGGSITKAVVQIGKPALPAIEKALGSPDRLVRFHAVTILGGFGPAAAKALPAIRNLANEPDLDTLVAACMAWYQISDEDAALAVLAKAAEGRPTAEQLAIALALARIGPPAAAQDGVFVKLLEDRDPNVRASAREAATALGPGATRVGAAIARAIQEPMDLGLIYPPPLKQLGPALKDAVPALRRFLREKGDKYQQSIVCEVLEGIGPAAKEAVPELVAVVERRDGTAASALRALIAIRPSADLAMQAALEGYYNKHFGTRAAALRLLGTFGPDGRDALKEVRQGLIDPLPEVRMWAIYAGTRITGTVAPYLPQLTRELQANGPGVWWGPNESGQVFIQQVLPELAPVAPEVLPAVLGWLRMAPPGRRAYTLAAIARYGPAAKEIVPTALAELSELSKRAVQTVDERARVLIALGLIGPAAADALPTLRALRDEPGWQVARAAARAVERIEGKK